MLVAAIAVDGFILFKAMKEIAEEARVEKKEIFLSPLLKTSAKRLLLHG